MGMCIGRTLDNGAVVVDYKITRSNTDTEGNFSSEGVLLAVRTQSPRSSRTKTFHDPYVVWRFLDRRESGQPFQETTCYGGWYYDGLRAAISSFESRSCSS